MLKYTYDQAGWLFIAPLVPRNHGGSAMAAARFALLASLLSVINAWRQCEFSETKWFALDELPGRSTPYGLAAMNGKVYAGGYMNGGLGLFGNTKDGVVPPDQARFGDAQSSVWVC